ncbi:MAG: alpha/beta hydrolase [bacterium]|nr:alpha/beta hydrolase [bacterium]
MIIGIHGLANKPERKILEKSWKKSILEGLQKNEGMDISDINYRMIYWADLLYMNQLHREAKFDFDSHYNKEPYVEAEEGTLKEYHTTFLDKAKMGVLDLVGDTVDKLKRDFGMDNFADWALGKIMKDLGFYYDNERQIGNRAGYMELARKVLRDDLKKIIREEKDKEIMLIAHSMGTIIAYDVLRDLGQSEPDIEVPYFVTIGSPLGLPHVKWKIIEERGYDPKVRTPTNVSKSWINYADKKDAVAIDAHLRDDYAENEKGVRVVDDLIANDYKGPKSKKKNHHKSYGYLRTPEISKHIKDFLD